MSSVRRAPVFGGHPVFGGCYLEDVHCSEGVQIRRFPMVGVCPRVSEDVQRI